MIGTCGPDGARNGARQVNALKCLSFSRIDIPVLKKFPAGGGTPVLAFERLCAPLAPDFFADLGNSARENFGSSPNGLGFGR